MYMCLLISEMSSLDHNCEDICPLHGWSVDSRITGDPLRYFGGLRCLEVLHHHEPSVMNSLAGFGVDADGPHVIAGGEFLDQYPQVILHKFVAQRL